MIVDWAVFSYAIMFLLAAPLLVVSFIVLVVELLKKTEKSCLTSSILLVFAALFFAVGVYAPLEASEYIDFYPIEPFLLVIAAFLSVLSTFFAVSVSREGRGFMKGTKYFSVFLKVSVSSAVFLLTVSRTFSILTAVS